MKAINTTTSTFARNLLHSNENLEILQKTINGFNGANIPNQIQIIVDKKSLKKELSDIVKGFNEKLPLELDWVKLRRDIETRIGNIGKGGKEGLADLKPLPLKMDWKTFRNSINEGILSIGQKGTGGHVDLKPLPLKMDQDVLLTSINDFLKDVVQKKHGIIPLNLTPEHPPEEKKPVVPEESKTKEILELLVAGVNSMVATQVLTNIELGKILAKTGTIDLLGGIL